MVSNMNQSTEISAIIWIIRDISCCRVRLWICVSLGLSVCIHWWVKTLVPCIPIYSKVIVSDSLKIFSILERVIVVDSLKIFSILDSLKIFLIIDRRIVVSDSLIILIIDWRIIRGLISVWWDVLSKNCSWLKLLINLLLLLLLSYVLETTNTFLTGKEKTNYNDNSDARTDKWDKNVFCHSLKKIL